MLDLLARPENPHQNVENKNLQPDARRIQSESEIVLVNSNAEIS
jgi:hypothetical protein